MVALWIVALFLAIPTYGISLAVVFVIDWLLKQEQIEQTDGLVAEILNKAEIIERAESDTRWEVVRTLKAELQNNNIKVGLSDSVLYDILGEISTRVNQKYQGLSLPKRSKLIIFIFYGCVYDCDGNSQKAISKMWSLLDDLPNNQQ